MSAKQEIKVINRFMDGTVIIGSVKGVKLPAELNEIIGNRLNGFKTKEVKK